MEAIFGILNDGGVLITYPILVLLIVLIWIFIKGLNKVDQRQKMRDLLVNIGWFALAWGYLGRTIGLIGAFDNIAAAGEIAPHLLSGGLKMALIGPLLGLFTFVLARSFIIIYILKSKK
jgi:hypothetical protein